MSRYNVGDIVCIASAEEIKRRGQPSLGSVSAPPGFRWPFVNTMYRHCGTEHKVTSKNGDGSYRLTNVMCMWEDWMLDDYSSEPEVSISFEEVFK